MESQTDAENSGGMELSTLKISTGLTIAYGIVGVTIAVICDSMAMMIDGLYAVADVIVSFFAMSVVRKIHLPPNEKYHFGYAKYEPFAMALEGILIVTICVAMIVSSVQDIIHPDPVKNIRLIVIYSFVSFFICTGFGAYMKRVGKRCRSALLEADAHLWIIEGVISLGVCAAFAVSEYILKTYAKEYSDYVDPILCIVLGVILLAKPIGLIRDSFYDLVDASPYADLKNEMTNIVRACALECQLRGVESVKLRKAGRKLFMIVNFLIDETTALHHTETARQRVIEKALTAHPDVDVTVLFTRR